MFIEDSEIFITPLHDPAPPLHRQNRQSHLRELVSQAGLEEEDENLCTHAPTSYFHYLTVGLDATQRYKT